MVFAFVDHMLTDPEQRALSGRWEIIDAAALELCRVERVKRLCDEASRSGELRRNFCRVLGIVASERHALVAIHRRESRRVLHEDSVEPVALHEEDVTHVAGILDRGPYALFRAGAQDTEPGG